MVRPITQSHHLRKNLSLTYVAGTGPGDVQNKLRSGALNVASMSPLGAVVSNGAGADVVI